MTQLCEAGLLASILLISVGAGVHAQEAARPLPAWQPALPVPALIGDQRSAKNIVPRLAPHGGLSKRSHTGTGLLVGGIIGVAATTVFLIGFCDDPDTQCGIDEVGRAVVFIALPVAAVGALIGSLIRTEE
jgi:hypothetical protein